jgi:hypothetical protein
MVRPYLLIFYRSFKNVHFFEKKNLWTIIKKHYPMLKHFFLILNHRKVVFNRAELDNILLKSYAHSYFKI